MPDAVSLRIAEAQDIEAITALTHEAYAKWVGVAANEPLPMRIDYSQAILTSRFDLLFVGDRLAGLIQTSPRGRRLLIESVAVKPDWQGRGFGVKLLKLAEDLALTSGLVGMRLYTNKLFSENLRLYASLGYRIEREEALNGGVAVHMVKALA